MLTEDAASFVAIRLGKDQPSDSRGVIGNSFVSAASASPVPQHRTFQPPTWLGWALMSVGAVLILHSLAMGKPG